MITFVKIGLNVLNCKWSEANFIIEKKIKI